MLHPFYVKNATNGSEEEYGIWKASANLVSGDELLTEDGRVVYVREVKIERLPQSIRVYNLEVEGLHTYYVGSGVLVHNQYGNSSESGNNASKDLRNTPDQNAVLELAKEAKRNGGVDLEDAKTIMEWAKEYDVPFHGPEQHPDRPQLSSQNWHFHIGNSSKTGHIPIIGNVISVFEEVDK